MDNRQSVCASIPSMLYNSLRREVWRNGGAALNNRKNSAASLRAEGAVKEAKEVEKEARVMREIAEREGIKLE